MNLPLLQILIGSVDPTPMATPSSDPRHKQFTPSQGTEGDSWSWSCLRQGFPPLLSCFHSLLFSLLFSDFLPSLNRRRCLLALASDGSLFSSFSFDFTRLQILCNEVMCRVKKALLLFCFIFSDIRFGNFWKCQTFSGQQCTCNLC